MVASHRAGYFRGVNPGKSFVGTSHLRLLGRPLNVPAAYGHVPFAVYQEANGIRLHAGAGLEVPEWLSVSGVKCLGVPMRAGTRLDKHMVVSVQQWRARCELP